MTRRFQAAAISFVLFASVDSLLAADELLKRVPADANALMVIDVAALQATPLALAQGWQPVQTVRSAAWGRR